MLPRWLPAASTRTPGAPGLLFTLLEILPADVGTPENNLNGKDK